MPVCFPLFIYFLSLCTARVQGAAEACGGLGSSSKTSQRAKPTPRVAAKFGCEGPGNPEELVKQHLLLLHGLPLFSPSKPLKILI